MDEFNNMLEASNTFFKSCTDSGLHIKEKKEETITIEYDTIRDVYFATSSLFPSSRNLGATEEQAIDSCRRRVKSEFYNLSLRLQTLKDHGVDLYQLIEDLT